MILVPRTCKGGGECPFIIDVGAFIRLSYVLI